MYVYEFLEYLKTHKSTTAVEAYGRAAKAFNTYLGMVGQDITNLEPDALRSFIQWLTTPEHGMRVPAAATVHLMIAGVRSYFDFLRGKRVKITEQATPHRPRLPERMPLVMSRDQLARYVQLCMSIPDPGATVLLILPYCGLRITEACELRLRDVLWHDVTPTDRRYILHVEKGKGGRERLVPMFTGPRCLISQALHLYLTQERPRFQDDKDVPRGERWLFPNVIGTRVEPISTKNMQRRVRTFRPDVRMDELHPHTCRAHYATALLSIPLDPLEVGRYLGHRKNLDTLANHYAGVRMENVEEWMGTIARPRQDDYQRSFRQRYRQGDSQSGTTAQQGGATNG